MQAGSPAMLMFFSMTCVLNVKVKIELATLRTSRSCCKKHAASFCFYANLVFLPQAMLTQAAQSAIALHGNFQTLSNLS